MNELSQAQQFSVGAVTIAANRDAAIRAEVLKVGDPIRILTKPDYGSPEVHTGVIVGFEPFKDNPTIVIAYIESGYGKAEMKMLYFNGNEKQKAEILAAPEDINIDIEKSRVIEWFNSERRKKQAELEELDAKEQYFNRYFGSIFAQIEGSSS